MAKNDNLKDFLTDVADAIREKKGTTDAINPQDFSSEIASIQSGGDIFGFGGIGYTALNVDFIDDVNYSLERKEQFELGEITSFANDTNIRFLPLVNINGVSSLNECVSLQVIPMGLNMEASANAFRNCRALLSIPNDISFANATSIANTFYGCSSITELSIYAPNANTINAAFRGCTSLVAINITLSPRTTNFFQVFHSCSSLEYLNGLDFSSITSMSSMITSSPLRYLHIKNIGTSSLTSFDFSGATNWGVATTDIPDARQSLIDSLITYSHDRASNGMATATIKLSANTKALLTEEEIAQITAKGFTIS